jgi:glycerol-3-phosphate cytidylyltransferase-like family protein
MSNKLVATWGTFDGKPHPGHIHFLKTCKQYGNVTVLLLDDAGIRRQKSREPLFPQAVRKANLLNTGLVDRVIEGGPDQEKNIQVTLDLAPDVYCFSEDQISPWNKKLEKLLEEQGVKVVWIPRYKPEVYSTTALYFSDKKTDRGHK